TPPYGAHGSRPEGDSAVATQIHRHQASRLLWFIAAAAAIPLCLLEQASAADSLNTAGEQSQGSITALARTGLTATDSTIERSSRIYDAVTNLPEPDATKHRWYLSPICYFPSQPIVADPVPDGFQYRLQVIYYTDTILERAFGV